MTIPEIEPARLHVRRSGTEKEELMSILQIAIIAGCIATFLTVLICLAKNDRNVPRIILCCMKSNLPIAVTYVLIRAAIILFTWISAHALLCITVVLLLFALIVLVLMNCRSPRDDTKTLCRQHLKEAKNWHCRMCRENKKHTIDYTKSVEQASASVLNSYANLIKMISAYRLSDPANKEILEQLSQIDEAHKAVQELWLHLLHHYTAVTLDLSEEVQALIDALHEAVIFSRETAGNK